MIRVHILGFGCDVLMISMTIAFLCVCEVIGDESGTGSPDPMSLETALLAVPVDLETERESVLRILARFRSREATLLDRTNRELVNLSERVKTDRTLSQLQRTEYLAQIDATRNWLNTGGTLTSCDATVAIIMDAAEKSTKLRSGLTRPFENLVRKLKARGQTLLALQIEKQFWDLGGSLNAAATFKSESVYKGYRIPADQTEGPTFRITLGENFGNRFSGKVERGWQFIGHPVHELNGELTGLRFRAVTGESLTSGNGLDSFLQYDGVMIGTVIAGTYSGKSRNGKPEQGTFRVELQ